MKGVSPEKWIEFKALAAKKKVPMGRLFEIIIEDYGKRNDSTWNNILKGEKILSEDEAEDMEKIVRNIRKKRGFRNVISH